MVGPTLAGKVNMPKEGSFAFDFCSVTEAQVLTSGDKLLVSHFKNIASLHTNPPGGAFDRTSSVCLGTYTNINGRQTAYGVCELTDQDGDKFWLEFNGSADGAGGKYTAPVGTGKYEGMTLNGEYVLDFWPSATRYNRQLLYGTVGLFVASMIPITWIMGKDILELAGVLH
jgi:hypothetical protein